MEEPRAKIRTLADGLKWRMAEMPDRGLALLKVLGLKNDSDPVLPVVVVVRSNGISLFPVQDGDQLLRAEDTMRFIAASKISLQKLTTLFSPQEAAECIAVFNFNRPILLQVVRPKEMRL